MNLKFRRNIPIILLFVSILIFLTVAMGNFSIVAY